MTVCDVCQSPADGWLEAPVKIAKFESKVDLCKSCIEYANLESLIVGMKEKYNDVNRAVETYPSKVNVDENRITTYTLTSSPLKKEFVKNVIDEIMDNHHEWMEIRFLSGWSNRLGNEERGCEA